MKKWNGYKKMSNQSQGTLKMSLITSLFNSSLKFHLRTPLHPVFNFINPPITHASHKGLLNTCCGTARLGTSHWGQTNGWERPHGTQAPEGARRYGPGIILHVNAYETVEGSGITGAVTSRGGIRLQYKQGKLNNMGQVDPPAPSRQDQPLAFWSDPAYVKQK